MVDSDGFGNAPQVGGQATGGLQAGASSTNAHQDPWGTYLLPEKVERLRAFSSRQDEGYVGKRLAFLARKFAMRMMGPLADVEIFGHKLRIDPRANLAEKRILFTPQYFDPIERDLLGRALPGDAVFLDIGANAGAYSFFAAQAAGPMATILAIEPQPAIYDRLVANIGFNPGAPIEPISLAVADVDDFVQLFVHRRNAGETGIRRIAGENSLSETITVPAKPLLSILEERGLSRVDGLKIDVEGAEDLVLVPFFLNAPQSLWPSIMVIENSPESWQTNCIELAIEKGYQLIATTRMNVVLTRANAG